jgi:hypothetical protein
MERSDRESNPLRFRSVLLFLFVLLFGMLSRAEAQYEIKSGVYNRLSGRVPFPNPLGIAPLGGVAVPLGSPTITPQFASFAEAASGTGVLSGTVALVYPSSVYSASGVTGGVRLTRSSVGTGFASGIPRYGLGDQILPPSSILSASGSLRSVTATGFWRGKPLAPGELLVNPSGAQPADYRDGSDPLLPALAPGVLPAYYYSPHARAVFANTAGTVSVTWVSNLPDPATNAYVFYKETFAVSSDTKSAVRNMYWTERSYSGPQVVIPTGQITRANPVFSNSFPETVASEIVLAGDSTRSTSSSQQNVALQDQTQIVRTLWFDKFNGVGRLHAYNLTGRILLEYLGLERGDGTFEFLGLDVINVDRSLRSVTQNVELGQEIRPFDGSQSDPNTSLVAAPVGTDSSADQTGYFGSTPRPDGFLTYYAERTNDIPERVQLFWLEPLPIGSATALAATTSNALINWPKYLNQYTLSWPSLSSSYVQYTVDPAGSSVASGTGLQFQGGNLPQLVFQDSPEGDLGLDTLTQRLLVNFSGESDLLNRSLLKFTGTNGAVWYVPMMTQGMGRTGYIEGDGAPAVTGTVYVGERLTPPSAEYSTAAYVASGSCYSASAYINPFVAGVAAAERGAVIPVNALPGGQSGLTVWWFKRIPAKSAEFSDFYTPAKIGRYTVAYRDSLTTGETFEQTPVQGWSDSRVSALVPPAATGLAETNVLGPFSTYFVGGAANSVQNGPATAKTFFPGAQGAGGISISFKLYRLDSWANKTFRVFTQPAGSTTPTVVLSKAFSSTTAVTTVSSGSVSAAGVSYAWSVTPVAGSYADFAAAGTPSVNDQIFQVTVLATPTNVAGADSLSALTVGFGSNLDSAAGSFAIDEVSLSLAAPKIILASNQGSGPLPAHVAAGFIYNQPDPTAVGYNPNEEHALLLDGRAYALRDDLNVVTGNFTNSVPPYTSQRRVLIQYTDPTDLRPAMAVYAVERENLFYKFDYSVTAGTVLNGLSPMPLPLLPLPLSSTGISRNTEVDLGPAYADSVPANGAPAAYAGFTYKDRKGYDWIYRGPHSAEKNPALGMLFYYTMRPDFFFPGLAVQPTEGTVLPYLRPLDDAGGYVGDAVSGEPLTVVYRPAWPAFPPTLSVGETLTLPKTGLPGVRGQTSAQVLYQQSVALGGAGAVSATLFDPTRAKTVLLNAAGVGLSALPASLKTTIEQGKTYFQLAQPHIQKRFYFSPLLGDKGGLVLVGEFHDAVAGEDYLDLNTLSVEDVAALKGLVAVTDADYVRWGKAIDSLATKMQTFVESPARPGTYVADANQDVVTNGVTLAQVSDSNTAVDSYALTGQGKGSGYVTLLFGDGAAFTPAGEPVSMQVVKVVNSLYKGDLKAVFAANPLDEQTTLRHSGDFAAHPEYFDFQWRYYVKPLAPAVYSFGVQRVLGGTINSQWNIIEQPAASPAPSAPLAYPVTASTLPYSLSINSGSYTIDSGLPGKVLRCAGSLTFGNSAPAQVLFSATLSEADGFVVYVNNAPALAYNLPVGVGVPGDLLPTTARVGLVGGEDGLARQFEIEPKYFRVGANRLEVALYSSTPPPSTPSNVDFRVHIPSKTDLVTASGDWMEPTGTLTNTVVLGGAAGSPLGNPLLVFSDAFFTMRYKARAGAGLVTGSGDSDWSEWAEPVFVPSWVKRVLDGINPFNQRETDLYNNPISTDVSVLGQAGKRWEGDVALTLSSINDFGLIEIYETVLNRVKAQSIDAGVTTSSVNNTLLLAAGYLSDLYMLVGNEAADDATNPTLEIDGKNGGLSVTSARFSFEGQVSTILDETLALWRGRDDLATGTRMAPAYNRLYWNYINGITSGEPIYAVNYNIKEKSGAGANGVIDATDAQQMFPQGHGDAYGHYLTALKVYYKLMTNNTFTWVPSAETVSILGQSVEVDYKDERKFATAAAAVAKAGYTSLALTARQRFQDGETGGWTTFSEATENEATGRTRYWGTDEWAARTYQGAYFNWINGNAMLPVNDTVREGVSRVDRGTVPELGELVTTASNLFVLSGGLQAFVSPLGLAVDSMTFDISPSELSAGKTHFEQLYDRAVRAGVNASESFFRAGQMNSLLRQQANSVDDYSEVIAQQEATYEYQLVTLFGTPYVGDIGPGALYAQGYTGPDLYHSFFIDKPSELVDTTNSVSVTFREPVNVAPFSTWSLENVYNRVNADRQYVSKTFVINKFTLGQFSTGAMGKRQQVGKIQSALLDCYQAQVNLRESVNLFTNFKKRFDRDYRLYSEMISGFDAATDKANKASDKAAEIANASFNLTLSAAAFGLTETYVSDLAAAFAEAAPTSVGFSNDVTSVVRAFSLFGGATASYARALLGLAVETKAALMDSKAADLEGMAQSYLDDFNNETANKQHVAEFERLYAQMLSTAFDMNRRMTELQAATERVSQIYGDANRILSERESFRVRAAAVVQGYRTRDVVYRDLRNEQLAQYNALFDLAQTYTYCAAKAYDYETGLLGSLTGQNFVRAIISNWSIGEFARQNPVSAKLGDPGLAGVLAALRDDWAVVKGRLGFNNPDKNGTLFSLRQELFRIRLDQPTSDDNDLWKQVLQQRVMSNVLNDSDVLKYCSNISKETGGPVPGFVIPFSTVIQRGLNFFGWPLAAGDHSFSKSTFATKILSAGVMFEGYIGMDPVGGGTPSSSSPNALSANPEIYLIPAGIDSMRTPPLGGLNAVRSWAVKDQALPLPLNIGASNYSTLQLFTPEGTLNEQLWIPRKHQAIRPVDSASYFYGTMPSEFTNSRLVGRSVWNSGWKIVIPAESLLSDEQTGINHFINTVSDIKLFLRTYSNSGN